jgi:hypothetical protein
MADRYRGKSYDLGDPAVTAFAVTPHDTNELTEFCRSLYVGGAGNLAVTTAEGDVVTFVAVPVGTIIPVRCSHVMATNTTATNIVALV